MYASDRGIESDIYQSAPNIMDSSTGYPIGYSDTEAKTNNVYSENISEMPALGKEIKSLTPSLMSNPFAIKI